MGVLGGLQLVDFLEVKVHLFLKGVDRLFAWSFEAVQPNPVSLGKCDCEVTDTTGVSSTLSYPRLSGEAMVVQAGDSDIDVVEIEKGAMRFPQGYS